MAVVLVCQRVIDMLGHLKSKSYSRSVGFAEDPKSVHLAKPHRPAPR